MGFFLLKKAGEVAYRIELPPLHVKICLGLETNVVSLGEIVYIEDLTYIPHELERDASFRERVLRNKLIPKFKLKWKDTDEENSTWELIAKLQRAFLFFVLRVNL